MMPLFRGKGQVVKSRPMAPFAFKKGGGLASHHARQEAEFFFDCVERGVCSVERALEDLGIPAYLEPSLQRFAEEEHGINRCEILRTLELRRRAVEEFRRLLAKRLPRAA